MIKKGCYTLLFIFILGYFSSAEGIIPVQNATAKDWNSDSYWYHPWGESGVHKGIDIFAKKGTPVLASTSGWVIFKGQLALGGNTIAVIGPKWRLHYYAHLDQQDISLFDWVSKTEKIGAVGDSGNAKGKPPHLHYSIFSIFPSITEITLEPQGWKRMFYMNPVRTWQ